MDGRREPHRCVVNRLRASGSLVRVIDSNKPAATTCHSTADWQRLSCRRSFFLIVNEREAHLAIDHSRRELSAFCEF